MKIENVTFKYNFEFDELGWKGECEGTQDLDFPVLYVTTRYYLDFTSTPTIYLGETVLFELPDGEYIEGDSEAECKDKTEQWIKEKLSEIIKKIQS